jgi:hypothetical protein
VNISVKSFRISTDSLVDLTFCNCDKWENPGAPGIAYMPSCSVSQFPQRGASACGCLFILYLAAPGRCLTLVLLRDSACRMNLPQSLSLCSYVGCDKIQMCERPVLDFMSWLWASDIQSLNLPRQTSLPREVENQVVRNVVQLGDGNCIYLIVLHHNFKYVWYHFSTVSR